MLCWDSSFECPQHMIRKLIVNYTLCSRGLLWYNMIMNTIKCLLTVKVFSFCLFVYYSLRLNFSVMTGQVILA